MCAAASCSSTRGCVSARSCGARVTWIRAGSVLDAAARACLPLAAGRWPPARLPPCALSRAHPALTHPDSRRCCLGGRRVGAASTTQTLSNAPLPGSSMRRAGTRLPLPPLSPRPRWFEVYQRAWGTGAGERDGVPPEHANGFQHACMCMATRREREAPSGYQDRSQRAQKMKRENDRFWQDFRAREQEMRDRQERFRRQQEVPLSSLSLFPPPFTACAHTHRP